MGYYRNAVRNRRRKWIIGTLLALGLASATIVGVSQAWSNSTNNPGSSVSALTLGAASGGSATTANGCLSITVSWTAATNANDYLVEIKTANGAYSTVNSGTGNVTSWIDTTNRSTANNTFTYRVTPLRSGTSWTGTPTTANIVCGIGEVSDLAATNGCGASPVTLTWTAAGGTATMYDIWRSVNGAAFASAATNIAATTWNDTTRTAGQSVRYYIVPNNAGGTNGQNSNTTTALTVGFVITSMTITNNGTANSVNAGDTISVTFSKASNGTTPAGTNSTSVYIRTNTATRGVYLANASGTAAGTGIILKVFGANIVGTNAAFTGTTAWSSGNTVWSWTSTNVTPTAEAAPASWGATTLGTSAANPSRVKCNNGTTNLSTSTFTPTGWF
jgi:hypothetical protein